MRVRAEDLPAHLEALNAALALLTLADGEEAQQWLFAQAPDTYRLVLAHMPNHPKSNLRRFLRALPWARSWVQFELSKLEASK